MGNPPDVNSLLPEFSSAQFEQNFFLMRPRRTLQEKTWPLRTSLNPGENNVLSKPLVDNVIASSAHQAGLI
jgi:hypothetical protein